MTESGSRVRRRSEGAIVSDDGLSAGDAAFGDAWEAIDDSASTIPPCDYRSGVLREKRAGRCSAPLASWEATEQPCRCVSYLCVAHAARWVQMMKRTRPSLTAWLARRRGWLVTSAPLVCASCGAEITTPTFRLI